ncbi:MAG: DUF2141 domain-containing protein [Ramlibacter sp.]
MTVVRHSIAWLFVFATASVAMAADLSVEVSNIKADGNIRVGLFNSADTFTKSPLRGESVKAKQGTVSVVFTGLPAGTYAVSAFQDLNANNKLDTNAFGKPNEPTGFSRDARGTFGPPSFDAASFSVHAGPNLIRVKLD